MVFVVILCHVVLKTSHLSTSYPGSVRNQRDWRGLPTAGLNFILIRSPCLEDVHSVRTSSPGPLVSAPKLVLAGPQIPRLTPCLVIQQVSAVILKASDKDA